MAVGMTLTGKKEFLRKKRNPVHNNKIKVHPRTGHEGPAME